MPYIPFEGMYQYWHAPLYRDFLSIGVDLLFYQRMSKGVKEVKVKFVAKLGHSVL